MNKQSSEKNQTATTSSASREEIERLGKQAVEMALSGAAKQVEGLLAQAGLAWLMCSVVGELGKEEERARMSRDEPRAQKAAQALIDCAEAFGRQVGGGMPGPMGKEMGRAWLASLCNIRFPQEAFDKLVASAGAELVASAYAERAASLQACELALDWGPALSSLPGFAERFVRQAEFAWSKRSRGWSTPRWTVGIAMLGDPAVIERCWEEGARLGLDMGAISVEPESRSEGGGSGGTPSALGAALMALNAPCVETIAKYCPPGAVEREIKALVKTDLNLRSSKDRARRLAMVALMEAIELRRQSPRPTTPSEKPRL